MTYRDMQVVAQRHMRQAARQYIQRRVTLQAHEIARETDEEIREAIRAIDNRKRNGGIPVELWDGE